jgi:dipeptidyl aminopeptidase/acylaminoacyl peptidase
MAELASSHTPGGGVTAAAACRRPADDLIPHTSAPPVEANVQQDQDGDRGQGHAGAQEPHFLRPTLITPAIGAVVDNGRFDRQDGIVWDFDWSDVPGAGWYVLNIYAPRGQLSLRTRTRASHFRHVSVGGYVIDTNRRGWTWEVLPEGDPQSASARGIFDVERLELDPRFPGNKLEFVDAAFREPGPGGPAVTSIQAHRSSVTCIAFAPDGQSLATGGEDSRLRLWDMRNRELVAELKDHTASVTCLRYSPDGKYLASGSADGLLRVWDLPTRQQRFVLNHGTSLTAIAFTSDGRTLASGDQEGLVRIWDLATGSDRQAIRTTDGRVWTLSFNEDGDRIVAGTGVKALTTWDVKSGQRVEATEVSHDNDSERVALSLRGMRAWARHRRGPILLYKPDQDRPIASLPTGTSKIEALCFDPQGGLLSGATSSGELLLWNIAHDLAAIEERRHAIKTAREEALRLMKPPNAQQAPRPDQR